MKQKKCKNKQYQRNLPEGYKYKYCENCRNEQVKQMKKGSKVLGVFLAMGSVVLTVAIKGNINLRKK